jgi:hypothetical protein
MPRLYAPEAELGDNRSTGTNKRECIKLSHSRFHVCVLHEIPSEKKPRLFIH